MTVALDTTRATLLDLMKSKDPNGQAAKLVEMLSARSELLKFLAFREGNLTTGHRVSSRTALPSVTWRRLNEGVPASKSVRTQFDEVCGTVSGRSEVDVKLVELEGGAAFRQQEDEGFLQAMNKEVSQGMFYHDARVDPKKFTGLASRFDATADPQGGQIVKHTAAASGSDQTSIWFVVTSTDTVFGFYPKGTPGGLKMTDMGKQNVNDAAGNPYLAWQTWWDWSIGLCVRDWRYVARVGNIDLSAISKTADDLIPAMIDAWHRLEDTVSGRVGIFANRNVSAYLHHQARNKVASQLVLADVEGKPKLTFMGAPILIDDGILNTEDVIT